MKKRIQSTTTRKQCSNSNTMDRIETFLKKRPKSLENHSETPISNPKNPPNQTHHINLRLTHKQKIRNGQENLKKTQISKKQNKKPKGSRYLLG